MFGLKKLLCSTTYFAFHHFLRLQSQIYEAELQNNEGAGYVLTIPAPSLFILYYLTKDLFTASDSGYARKCLTFNGFKQCTSSGRYIAYRVRHAELIDTCYRITATNK